MKLFIQKSIIFCCIFIILFSFLTILFVRKGNGYGTDVFSFYRESKNSLDILFVGSSHTYATFDPQIIKEKTGLSSYVFATQQQPIWISYFYIKEALKSQKPKYVVLDIFMVNFDDEYAAEGVNRDALDKLRLSTNKINAIKASVPKEERTSYYINFIKYHSRWKGMTLGEVYNLVTNKAPNEKGYTILPDTAYIFPQNSISQTTSTVEISQKNKDYLYKIINLSKEYNFELILVKTPSVASDAQQQKYNYTKQIASNNDIDFIDYNLLHNELNLDYNIDFHSAGHLSRSGAIKASNYFAQYLNEKEQNSKE